MFCKICNQEVDNKHFYRIHKLALVDYISQYEPRYDLLTQERISFKGDYDRYVDTDFVNRNNLKKWLKSKDLESCKKYCFDLLKRRAERKKLKYLPTHVELKSLLCPGVIYFDDIFSSEGGYLGLAAKLGLEKRFTETTYFNDKIDNTQTIIIDTREQKPLKFLVNTKVECLKFGDYALESNKGLVIERKSLTDFVGTLSSRNIERFEREIVRAAEANSYIVVLVEESMNRCLAFDKLPWVTKQIKASPDYIFGNVRELLQKHKNIQFVFCEGRIEMSKLILSILNNQGFCKDYDLQKLYDLNILV